MEQAIRDYNGRILGFIATDEHTGNKVAKDYYGKILGRYEYQRNVTTDYYSNVLSQGDILTSLIMENARGNK